MIIKVDKTTDIIPRITKIAESPMLTARISIQTAIIKSKIAEIKLVFILYVFFALNIQKLPEKNKKKPRRFLNQRGKN